MFSQPLFLFLSILFQPLLHIPLNPRLDVIAVGGFPEDFLQNILKFANTWRIICIFAADMVVIFEKDYLKELYFDGKTHSKQYRFQPDIVSRYVKVINMMINANNINDLMRFGSLHYEHLTGDKKGISSVRVNDKYRVEFIEKVEGEQKIATICNILELTNHYK